MKLHINGIGTCMLDDFADEDIVQSCTINNLPVKEYMSRDLRRTSAKLAKMFYIAAVKALKDVKLNEENKIPVVAGTSMGEIEAGLNMLSQINESKGTSLSPTLVQNSVYNAPAGFLTIGMQNNSPALTLTQSFLSGESIASYAQTLLEASNHNSVMVILGDIFIYDWIERLYEYQQKELSAKLNNVNFFEGAVSLILSSEKYEKNYGQIINSAVIHLNKDAVINRELLLKYDFSISACTKIVLRDLCMDRISDTDKLIKDLDITKEQLIIRKYSSGTFTSYPFNEILHFSSNGDFKDVIFLSSEYNDLGMLHYKLS